MYKEEDELKPITEMKLSSIEPKVICEGADITIVGSSYSTKLAVDAANLLKSNYGISSDVVDLRVYNKVGQGKYSSNEVSQPYVDDATREIDLLGEYTLFGDPVGMFEVKFPTSDIKVRVK